MNSQDLRVSLTDQSYWERIWRATEEAKLFDSADRSLANRGNVALHEFFSGVLRTLAPAATSLVEIGCAQSRWLPYFARTHNLAVAGVDYSELGCARARSLLQRAKCEGEIFQADIFDPPAALLSRFDVVLSMGLVEHFADTAAAIRACAALVKPGGTVVTTIPNLTGAIGSVQRRLDRAVYDKHVPLDCAALRAAHEKSDLAVLRSEYLLSANFAVLNLPNLRPRIFERAVRGLAVTATAGIWALEGGGIHIAPTQFLSPYVACVARKGGAPPA